MMDEYTKWCDSETNQKEDAIATAGRTINELKATIEESSGSISALTGEIEELAGKISASEADLANATGIRTAEKAAFDATEKELVETQDSLERALVMIKRNMGFMQGKAHKKNMDELVTSLKTIVDASWISNDEKAKVQKLLQTEDSLSKARRTEMEANHAYELLKQSIEMELSGMQKRMAAATNERSSTEETMHAATAELEETKKSKAA